MSKKISGIVLSYLLIVIDIVVGIVFVPFLLHSLGDEEYGLYKLMVSTASYLSVLDFGMGGTITRYIVKYRTQNDLKEEENFLAMGLIIYAVLSCAVLLIASVVCVFLPKMYSASVPESSIAEMRIIFLTICSTTAVSLFNHAYNGLLNAYERFVFVRLTNIVKILFRVVTIVVGLQIVKSAVVVAIVDLILAVLLLVCNILYSQFVLKRRAKLHKWKNDLAKEAGIFTLAILLQSIINQFNSNVDNIVLGIFTTTSTVAMYSLVLQLQTMYSCLSTAVSSVYLPTVSSAVFSGASDKEITNKIIEPSRIQLVILLLALTGFYIFGNEFISLWVGDGYNMVYILACALLTAGTLELSQNTITSVLKAKNMLHGKTFILAASTVCNIILTTCLVPEYGAAGAAFGTVFSYVFGYGVGLNIYYHRRVRIDIKMYFSKTYKGIAPAVIIAFLVGLVINKFIVLAGWTGFIIKAACYAAIYCIIVYFVGINSDEKKILKKLLPKRLISKF